MSTQQSANTCLIIVDLQNDFCSGGALAVSNSDRECSELVHTINNLIPYFKTVVITQDWHPQQHFSFASQHPGSEPFTTVNCSYGKQILWPDHCVQGSKGANLHADLQQWRADLILRKGCNPAIDSYSAFRENDKTTMTGLAGYLHSRKITNLVFCGLAFDFCVAWSALDAAELEFNCTVICDACLALNQDGSKARAEAELRLRKVDLIVSTALATIDRQ